MRFIRLGLVAILCGFKGAIRANQGAGFDGDSVESRESTNQKRDSVGQFKDLARIKRARFR